MSWTLLTQKINQAILSPRDYHIQELKLLIPLLKVCLPGAPYLVELLQALIEASAAEGGVDNAQIRERLDALAEVLVGLEGRLKLTPVEFDKLEEALKSVAAHLLSLIHI